MAGAIVQTAYGFDDSGSTFTTRNISLVGVAAGNLIVGVPSCDQAGSANISVSDGTAYTSGFTKTTVSGALVFGSQPYYRPNVNSGSHTIVTTFSVAAAFPRIRFAEVSGCATVSPLDQATGQGQTSPGTGASGVTSGNTSATTNANDFNIAFSVNATETDPGTGTMTATNSYTNSGSNLIVTISSKNVAATGVQAGTWTQSVNNARTTFVLCFKQAAGGGTTINATLATLSLTKQNATINRAFSATFQQLVLSTLTATINRIFNATKQSLILTTFQALISSGTTIAAGFQALVLSAKQAQILLSVVITATSQALVLSTKKASTLLSVIINATRQQLQLQTFQATVTGSPPTPTGKRVWTILGLPIAVRF